MNQYSEKPKIAIENTFNFPRLEFRSASLGSFLTYPLRDFHRQGIFQSQLLPPYLVLRVIIAGSLIAESDVRNLAFLPMACNTLKEQSEVPLDSHLELYLHVLFLIHVWQNQDEILQVGEVLQSACFAPLEYLRSQQCFDTHPEGGKGWGKCAHVFLFGHMCHSATTRCIDFQVELANCSRNS